MPNKSTFAPLFSQVDVSTGSVSASTLSPTEEQSELLREVLVAQDRTNELLEELVGVLTAQHRQRAGELERWRKANPELTVRCRESAETLSRVQVEFLDRMTEEVADSSDELVYGDFMLSEFIDRYGPRMAQLGGVIQVLAQLGNEPQAPAVEPQD
ncbi:MAG: hypothetical protein ACRCT8_10240 [Lacipirellulaceae bacterium]